MHVQPFRLRLPSNDAVLVLPDERIRLVDTLETETRKGTSRRRGAQLNSGESAWVSGVLAHEGSHGDPSTAYRSGPGSLILRGTRTEPLECAAGSLDAQFSHWRRFYLASTIVLGLMFLLVHGVLLPFYALLLAGEVDTATITGTSTYSTKSKAGDVVHYVIHAVLSPKAGSVVVKDDVNIDLYNEAKFGLLSPKAGSVVVKDNAHVGRYDTAVRLKQVPFIYLPAAPSLHSIGSHADLSRGVAYFGAICALAVTIVFPLMRRRATPWYEQSGVTERGSGRLTERA